MSDKNDSPKPSRREFLGSVGAAFGAAVMASQFPSTSLANVTVAEDASPDLKPLLEKLSAIGAVDVDGKKVDAAELGKKIKGKNIIVVFGFQGCKAVCLPLNRKLAAIEGRVSGDFVSIHINTNPEDDNKDNAARKAFVQDAKDAGCNKHTVIGVFPKTSKDAEDLQTDFMNLMVGGGHSGAFSLYTPDGKWDSRIDAMHNDTDKIVAWAKDRFQGIGRAPGR